MGFEWLVGTNVTVEDGSMQMAYVSTKGQSALQKSGFQSLLSEGTSVNNIFTQGTPELHCYFTVPYTFMSNYVILPP